jgi:DNA-binding CsgD family transcriptional regulator
MNSPEKSTSDEHIIRAIASAYGPGKSERISKEDITEYIRSVDFLEDILSFSRTAFIVVEFNPWSYLYCSANVLEVLGHTPEQFMAGGPVFGLRRIHRDDLETQVQVHNEMVQFLVGKPESERKKYKFSFTSRLIHGDGREVQILQNNFFLKWDATGNPMVKLITFTDITWYKDNSDFMVYVTRTNDDGSNDVIKQENYSGNEDRQLSNRELEILQWMCSGKTAEEIAETFSLSKNTVKTHKKAILKKLGCSNSAQAIALAGIYGLLRKNEIKHTMPG